jgi:CRISPR-associated endonuclease Cas1
MQSGHLEIEDGVGMDRRKIRLARVGHRLRLLVCVTNDGTISLSALRWVNEQKAAFVLLERDGRVFTVCGPASRSQARLRRAQALAHHTGKALEISKKLISVKMEGEESVLREQLQQPDVANSIAHLRARLIDAENLDRVCFLEAEAAKNYWSSWSEVPIMFPRKDIRRVPAHWLRFGSRHSPITGGPRLAINPPNAVLNYVFAIAESECRLALCACGLDPGIGFVHLDTANRDSLALDLLETIRPSIEAWLLHWITRESLRRSDFFETGSGNCRLRSSICSQLSETAPTWGRLIAPWAEYVVHSLWAGCSNSKGPSTRLTQRNKREAKGIDSSPISTISPRLPCLCNVCGRTVQRKHDYCQECAAKNSTACLISGGRLGRVAAQTAQAQERRKDTKRLHDIARKSWSGANQPASFTAENYMQQILPGLARVTLSQIASAIGVSIPYASDIRRGRRRPHPRHWDALSNLVGAQYQLNIGGNSESGRV